MEFNERFGSPQLTFNTLDPGTVNTKMLDAGWGMCGIPVLAHSSVAALELQLLGYCYSALSRADNQYHLATSPELEGVTGEYFVSKRKSRAHSACYDAAARKQLWQYLAKLSDYEY
eukprot:5517-Heterococcus_DN1.PRE.2